MKTTEKINKLKKILVEYGYMPGHVDGDAQHGFLHVWSAEIDPKTKRFVACVTYDCVSGYMTLNRLNGPGDYRKIDNGEEEEKRSWFH